MTFLATLKTVATEAWTGFTVAFDWAMKNKPHIVAAVVFATGVMAYLHIPIPPLLWAIESAAGLSAVGSHIKQNA